MTPDLIDYLAELEGVEAQLTGLSILAGEDKIAAPVMQSALFSAAAHLDRMTDDLYTWEADHRKEA